MRIANVLVSLSLIAALSASAEEARRLDAPAKTSAVKVIGTWQYEQPKVVAQSKRPESPVSWSRGYTVTSTVVQPEVKRVISSNELMKLTCVNGICADYVPAGRDVVLPMQPSPNAPVAPRVLATVTTTVTPK